MTGFRPRYFPALVAVAIVVVLYPGSGAFEATSPPAAGPRRVHRPTERQLPPAQPYGIAIAYYSVRGNLDTRLTLNNKGPNDMAPVVTLYARDGRRFSSGEIPIAGRTSVDLDLRTLVAAAGEGFEDGSLRVAYRGRIMELGGMLRMTSEADGTEWHDQLMYNGAARSNRLEGVWWLPNEAADARLIVTNATSAATDATVTFAGTRQPRTETVHLGPWQLAVLDFGKPADPGARPRDGRIGGITVEYTGAPGGVLARGYVLHAPTGYSAVVAMVDPAEAKTSSYQAGGVRVLPVGNIPLEPVLVARNVGSTQITVRGRLQVTTRDETVTPVDLPSATIGPMQSVALDGRAAWQEAADTSNGTPVGLELEHDGAPGSLVVSAASVGRDGNQVFQVPLTDPDTLPSSTGGYFWRVEGTRNSVVALKNMTDAPQRYNLEIRFNDGVWGQGLRTLQPQESVVIDIGALQQRQTPDRQGRTIPVTATRGQVHWSIGGGGTARGIVGRIEHVDLARGVSSAYACPQATNDIFVDAWIEPDLQTIAVGGSELYVAWEQDEDAWGGGLQSPYEITDILSWQSWNTSVAAIVSVGGDVAEVGGVATGFTGIEATGESNGWAEYDPSGEEPENHIPVDLFADADVQYAVPTGESTTSVGWHADPYPTAHDFRQTLQGGSFDGRVVHEEDGGNGNDTCWFANSAISKFEAVTGGQWTVDANNKWGLDSVGWFTSSVTYYRNQGRAPCGTQFDQKMYINRPGTSDAHYATNLLKAGLTATSVWSERAGVYQSRIWP